MTKVLVTVLPVSEEHKKQLEARGEGCEFVYKRTDLTPDDVSDADIIVGNVSPKLLAHARKLRWLQLNSAGADVYTVPGVLPEGCTLTSASGAYGLSVSEHMLALTFALVRHFDRYIPQQRDALWQHWGQVISVEGSTVLVMGIGDIGGSYARKMKALGAKVIGLRRHMGEKPDYLDEVHTLDDLDSLLPRADIVAMVLPGGPATHHLMDERRLRLMKQGAYIINVGRGNAIDPAGLKKVLAEGRIGAALDVTEPEPLPADDALWHMENVIITPHVAGHFYLSETVNRIVRIAAENLHAWLNGGTLRNVIDLTKGY